MTDTDRKNPEGAAAAVRLNAMMHSAFYAIAAILIASASAQIFLSYLFERAMTEARLAGLLGLAAVISCTLFYRVTGLRKIASILLLGSTFLALLAAGLRNGGLPSPTIAYFAFLPLAATILFNRIGGAIALAGVALVLAVHYAAAQNGWASPSPYTAAQLKIQYVSATLLAAGAIAAIALLYEKAVETSMSDLGETAKKLHREVEISKERLQELIYAEERFTLATQGASVGIWEWSGSARSVATWTDQLYKVLGYEPGEITPSLEFFEGLIHPEDLQRTQAAVQTHFEQRGPFEIEYRLRHKTRGYRWYLGTGQAVWDEETGEPRRMIGAIMDIDERKRMEIMKSQFIQTVSHELRTPMTSIIGSINLIRTEKFGQLPEKARQLLDIASRNGARLVRLVNDILDLEKIDSGSMSLDLQEVDLAGLLRAAVDENEPFAAQRGAAIVCNAAGGASFTADRDRIMQVLTNLISNAAKFSGEGGRIMVSGEADEREVILKVADNGRGMPEDKLHAIFDRFVQIDGSATRDQEGTGLGLAICKAIVEAHGGRISVDSSPGQGAAFTVVLPRRRTAERAA